MVKNQRTNDSRLQRQETSRRRAVGEADEEEEQQGRSRGWPRAAAATPHVGLRNVENYALRCPRGAKEEGELSSQRLVGCCCSLWDLVCVGSRVLGVVVAPRRFYL